MSTPLPRRAGAEFEPGYVDNIERSRNDMLATIRLDASLATRAFDHRATPRMTIALPIFIVLAGKRHNAILRNLSIGGALVVTSAPMVLHMKIEFHCGTICASGTVVWQRSTGSGIKFDTPVCERQLKEQVSRSNAVNVWSGGHPLTSVD